MSSNIRLQRVCQQCGNEFTAQTTVTKYCSATCAKRAYKARQRTAKVEVSNRQTEQVKSKPFEELKQMEFLTVRQVSKLLNCSRQTVYNLINSGMLKAVNIKIKKTLIRRSDIDKLFEQPEPVKPQPEKQPEQVQLNETECYNLKEVQEKYGISEKALAVIIKRNNIPKVKQGWFAYVPKTDIDRIFINP